LPLIGIVILLLAVSMIPAPREWCMPVSAQCGRPAARQCLAEWQRCAEVRQSKFRENAQTLPGTLQVADHCRASYAQQCAQCGEPADTGEWFDRLRRNGPWFLNLKIGQMLRRDPGTLSCPYGESGTAL
jgi:hypothetical protein